MSELAISKHYEFEGEFFSYDMEELAFNENQKLYPYTHCIVNFKVDKSGVKIEIGFASSANSSCRSACKDVKMANYDSLQILELRKHCKTYKVDWEHVFKIINYAFYCQGLYDTLCDKSFSI